MKADQRSKRRLLSVAETAAIMSISPRTIYNRLSAGTFPIKAKRILGGKKGRGKPVFDSLEVSEYIEDLVRDN